MDLGWVKIHRRIEKKGYYTKSEYVHLWIHLLLKANHERKEFMFNNQIMVVKQGQLLTGRKQLSEETGISESTLERILKLFENEHQIEQQKTTKYRVITILHWKEYQVSDNKVDNKWTTDGQQMDTNKNIKNDKNDKNTNIKDYMVRQEFEKFWDLYDKKRGDKEKLIKKWAKLSEEEKKKIFEYVPKYKLNQPDKTYRKDPQTFLNNKSWNDELIPSKQSKMKGYITVNGITYEVIDDHHVKDIRTKRVVETDVRKYNVTYK
jgi:hypothetical protein